MSDPASPPPRGGDLIRRHGLVTRLWHWTNAVAVITLFMSGLMIFNAHPRLYWGEYGANFDHAWLEIGARGKAGFLRIGELTLPTTGLLGLSGDNYRHAFPGWITIPSHYSLADGRLWHLAFAWILGVGLALFILASLFNRHFVRDLRVRLSEIRPQSLWHDMRAHARLRFPTGAAARDYSILQKLAYVYVIFIALPVMILTGLTMSPAMAAAWPWLLDLFGGRQSARSIHFLIAWSLAGFFIVHIAMVILAGPFNELRSMITGRYRLRKDRS